MKRILIPLLALALLCTGLTALAEEGEAVSVQVNTAKLSVYEAGDPWLDGLLAEAGQEDAALPVLVVPVRKSVQLSATVQPKTVKNKKVTFTADDADILRVQGNRLTGLKEGETVLTVASAQDPSAAVRYRVLVIQQATRISVKSSAKTVAAGQTASLTAEFTPANATKQQVTWSSADEKTATVDANGTVTGVSRGTARIIAAATDGSGARANISIQITQGAEEITLNQSEITVDVGRNGVLKATVLPKNTNDKNVVWSSSDESVAKVNAQGRVTGVALGDCEITCASRTNGDVQAKALVHVQLPVKKVTLNTPPVIYVGESAKLTWRIEPADATNQVLAFTSANPKILTVSEDGTITGVRAGEATVNVVTTDGSNRRAKVKVKVYQHVTEVHMKRHTAYLDINETATTGAVIEPDKNTNHNMTWVSADPSIATVEAVAKQTNRVKIRGVSQGTTYITGTTEDGGYQTSMEVKVGNWSRSLKITEAYINGKGWLFIKVKNVSNSITVSNIKIEIEARWADGSTSAINTKNGSNVVEAVYSKKLRPGESTPSDQWVMKDYDKDAGFQWMTVRVTQFQINGDWVKTIRKNKQPKYEYKP